MFFTVSGVTKSMFSNSFSDLVIFDMPKQNEIAKLSYVNINKCVAD